MRINLNEILARDDYKRMTENLKSITEEVAIKIHKKMDELDIESNNDFDNGEIGAQVDYALRPVRAVQRCPAAAGSDRSPCGVIHEIEVVMPELTIGWVDNATDNTSQNIYRSERYIEEEALPAPVASVGADLAVYTDAGVQDDRCYFYRVGAVSPVGEVVSSQLIAAATENLWVPSSAALATITALSAHYGAMSPSASRSAMSTACSRATSSAPSPMRPTWKASTSAASTSATTTA